MKYLPTTEQYAAVTRVIHLAREKPGLQVEQLPDGSEASAIDEGDGIAWTLAESGDSSCIQHGKVE